MRLFFTPFFCMFCRLSNDPYMGKGVSTPVSYRYGGLGQGEGG